MSWVKLDDGMPDSLKIAPLSDAAFRAYVTSICYSARNLTDGFVPLKKAKEIAGRTRVIQELMPCLWENVEGGIQVHDFLDYNPTRAEVLAKRAADSDRKRAGNWRDSTPPVPDPVPGIPDPKPQILERFKKGRGSRV